MNAPELQRLLDELVIYTFSVHQALESEADPLNRPHHLGHLAMAARIFMYLHAGNAHEELSQVVRIENRSHALKLPGDAAATVRGSWLRLAPLLASYLNLGS
jgi:hypothetical protein